MSLLDRLERKLGFLAVPHVTWVLVVGQVLGYFSVSYDDRLASQFFLLPALVLQGEWWRLFSFVFMPPTLSPIFLFISLYLLLMMGNALETTWGAFRYNAFLLVGYATTVAAAFLTGFFPSADVYWLIPTTNVYWLSTVFLAFAALFPDFQLMLFFVLPVKIRWLALITWGTYAYAIVTGNWVTRVAILSAMTSYALFFAKEHIRALRDGKRRADHATRFKDKRFEAEVKDDGVFHRCAECGITDKSSPTMDFRYCDECDGQVGFCRDHIRAHEHQKSSESSSSSPVTKSDGASVTGT
jgi:hypothetical protein